MRWRILAIGKPRLAFARDGIAEYLTRLRCFHPVEPEYIKASDSPREGTQLLARSAGCFRIVLDEHGRTFDSRSFAAEIERIETGPHKSAAVLVGGAAGHPPEVRAEADLLWSLSPMTLQHELALVVALEQLYRAQTLRADIPYHRD